MHKLGAAAPQSCLWGSCHLAGEEETGTLSVPNKFPSSQPLWSWVRDSPRCPLSRLGSAASALTPRCLGFPGPKADKEQAHPISRSPCGPGQDPPSSFVTQDLQGHGGVKGLLSRVCCRSAHIRDR